MSCNAKVALVTVTRRSLHFLGGKGAASLVFYLPSILHLFRTYCQLLRTYPTCLRESVCFRRLTPVAYTDDTTLTTLHTDTNCYKSRIM